MKVDVESRDGDETSCSKDDASRVKCACMKLNPKKTLHEVGPGLC